MSLGKLKTFVQILGVISMILMIIAGTLYLNNTSQSRLKPLESKKDIVYGVTDSKGVFDKNQNIIYESVYWKWNDEPVTSINEKVDTITKKTRTPIIMVEPWLKNESSVFIFNKIIEGNYLKIIETFCANIESKKTPVLVSFGHGMDLANSKYPWSNDDGSGYIMGYKYFVNKCKAKTNYAKYIWSPDGSGYVDKYYPGKNFVDIIGLSVTADEKLDDKTFKGLFNDKYARIKNYKQPVMITQLGVSGTPKYQREWLDEAKRIILDKDLQRYLTAVIYNQDVDKSGTKYTLDPVYIIPSQYFPFQ